MKLLFACLIVLTEPVDDLDIHTPGHNNYLQILFHHFNIRQGLLTCESLSCYRSRIVYYKLFNCYNPSHSSFRLVYRWGVLEQQHCTQKDSPKCADPFCVCVVDQLGWIYYDSPGSDWFGHIARGTCECRETSCETVSCLRHL